MDSLVYANRKQLQVVNGLSGDRNAQRILSRMEKEKTIQCVRREQKIYYLSNRGKELIGSHQATLKRGLIDHTLMRNDLYIMLGMPKDWKKEYPVTWGDNRIIPDAIFKEKGEFRFVEVDNRATMRTNIDKIKKYKELSKVIFDNYNHSPTLIWYTLSEIRKQKLKEVCETLGVKYRIYGNM